MFLVLSTSEGQVGQVLMIDASCWVVVGDDLTL